MPLVLSEVLLSDLPEVHRLSLSADQQSATSELLFPNGPSEASITHLVKQDEKDMRDLSSTCRHVIIRDISGDVQGKGEAVSYALWNFFVGRGKESIGQKDEGGGRDGAYYESWPPDANQEALGALVEMGRRKRESIMGHENYACKSIWAHSSYVCNVGRQLSVLAHHRLFIIHLLGPRLAYFRFNMLLVSHNLPSHKLKC